MNPDSFRNDPEVVEYLEIALKKIYQSMKADPSELECEMGHVQSALSLMRNRLIEYRRAAEDPAAHADLAAALNGVNSALSHIVGVEYPLSGIHRNLLSQAEKILKELPVTGNNK